jgi:RNA polymerase-binding transcription factor DksA
MLKEELEKYKNALLKLKKHLEKEIKETPDIIDYGERADPEGAEADEETAADLQLGVKTALRSRLEDVKSALIKIGKGTYGLCEIGNEEIEKEILEIDPESRYCLRHKK